MNIAESEEPVIVVAKTCGCKEKGKRVTYSLVDAYHSLCLDKKDIIASELEACERSHDFVLLLLIEKLKFY
jgi:hypothetical protein